MASNFSPMYFEQPIVIFDTTQSLNSSTGSFVLYGGVSVHSTYQSTDTSSGSIVVSGGIGIQKNLNVGGIQTISNDTESTGNTVGGALVVSGGVGIVKNLNVGGIQTISNDTQSTSTGDGALVVAGGVGIARDLNVGGDATIAGNLYVNGIATYVNTETMNVEDNTLVLNAGPAGSGDAGILIHRSLTDVTGETAYTTGNVQGLPTATSITLPANASSSDNFYNGAWIKLSDNSIAHIADYNGTTKIATLSTTGNTLTSGTLTSGMGFSLYIRNYLAQYYDESSDEVRFAYVADATDINRDLNNFENYANIKINRLDATAGMLVGGNSTISSLAVSNLLVATVSMNQASLGLLTVTGPSYLEGSLTVTGASILHSGVTAGTLNVTGASLLQGGLTAGTLNVTGASLLQLGVTAGTLNVTGESWLQGAVTAGALNVTGQSLLQLGVTAGSLNVTGESTLHANVTMGSNAVVVGPAFQIPYGDTASRPTPAQDGYIRYNTEYSSFEGYGPGDAWGSLGGVIDIAQTTKILASASPNVTDGNLYFYTKGVEYMRINSAGNIGIHTTAPNYTLDVIGTLGVSVGVTTGSLNVTGASIMEDNLTVTTGSVIISTNDYTPIIGATSATGGSIIFNSVDVSPSMGDISRERSFNSANNVSSASNITGFAFSNAIVRAFDAVLSVTILSSEGNKYAYYNLKGVQKGSNWVINSSYVGDVTGYTFSITNAGQVQYTSTDVDGWTSATINFRALTTTI